MRHFMGFILRTASGVFMGCGGQTGTEGAVAATGTVTYQGQPVEGATVVFAPEGQGRASSAITDASGRFQLTTLGPGDGAMPGKYQVGISKTETSGDMSREESQAYFEKHGEPPTVTTTEALPEKYKSPANSGLTAEITEGGKNDFNFDLTD